MVNSRVDFQGERRGTPDPSVHFSDKHLLQAQPRPSGLGSRGHMRRINKISIVIVALLLGVGLAWAFMCQGIRIRRFAHPAIPIAATFRPVKSPCFSLCAGIGCGNKKRLGACCGRRIVKRQTAFSGRGRMPAMQAFGFGDLGRSRRTESGRPKARTGRSAGRILFARAAERNRIAAYCLRSMRFCVAGLISLYIETFIFGK
jgi:hypothetical protein